MADCYRRVAPRVFDTGGKQGSARGMCWLTSWRRWNSSHCLAVNCYSIKSLNQWHLMYGLIQTWCMFVSWTEGKLAYPLSGSRNCGMQPMSKEKNGGSLAEVWESAGTSWMKIFQWPPC